MGKTPGTLLAIVLLHATPAVADPFVLTYSYSNLLDGNLHTVLSAPQLRAATEESLGLWSRYAPIDFHEVPDAGPPPSDHDYPAAGTPDIRIGHHNATVFTHAYFPWAPGGLARDVHLRTRYDDPFYWGTGDDPSPYAVDVMATMVHELGHALGLVHYDEEPSLMNASLPWRYSGLGSAFLFPHDILTIQALYGVGIGSVHPMDDALSTPEPGTLVLLTLPLASLIRHARSTARARRAGVR
jgi:hypothetical protein